MIIDPIAGTFYTRVFFGEKFQSEFLQILQSWIRFGSDNIIMMLQLNKHNNWRYLWSETKSRRNFKRDFLNGKAQSWRD